MAPGSDGVAPAEIETVPVSTPGVFRWSQQTQMAFIQALTETGRADRAAAMIGTTAPAVYSLRRRDAAFAAAWADALACHAEIAGAMVLDAAVNGYEMVSGNGRKRVMSERLMIEVLKTKLAQPAPEAQVQEANASPPGRAGEAARLKIEAELARIAAQSGAAR